MKRHIFALVLTCLTTFSIAQQNTIEIVGKDYIEKVLNILASDEMGGRHALTPYIAKAADYIAQEFKEIGVQPYAEDNFRQTFTMSKVSKISSNITFNNKEIENDSYLIISNNAEINWDEKSKIAIKYIDKEDDFATTYRSLVQQNENLIIVVDPAYASYIKRFNKIYAKENVIAKQSEEGTSKVLIVSENEPKSFKITSKNKVEDIDLFNVAAVIPGKSKPNEYVVFSAHYDHIGKLAVVEGDSIANGADDDASGVTAMISLAKYYKAKNNNERTLIFVAFTAEEIGMFGSKYFSNQINADNVVAMINIEMIGKDSKFGPNTMYLTGYDMSNLGKLMQENLKNTAFKFHADPYPKQNLFYRSDNAVLAALGVPAHTFSTSQIDKDEYYHTVKDDVTTLDIKNIKSSIEAIAIGAEGIVKGIQTPSRVEKLKD